MLLSLITYKLVTIVFTSPNHVQEHMKPCELPLFADVLLMFFVLHYIIYQLKFPI